MKNKNKITLIALAAGTLVAVSLSAQTVTYYGVADNAIAAGVTGVDDYSAIAVTDWNDTYLDGGNPTGAGGFFDVAQVRGEKTGGLAGTNLNMLTAFSFTGLSIADPIVSASLRLNVTVSNGPYDVFLGGIGTGSGFNEATSTYDSIVNGGYASIANTANPVTVTSGTKIWLTFDVTTLLQDYLAGNNDGIYINNSTTFFGSLGAQPNMLIATSEDTAGDTPGLVVTTVPEPSAALLIGLGVLGLVVRRRR